jgi:hypothetical protein
MPALGQIRQAEQKGGEQHARRKAEQVMQTQEEYRRLAEEQRRDLANSTPAFTPARMNVDVQMVLAKSELKNFAEAKAATVASIADGDPVWLFVKFNGKLGQWVYKLRDGSGGERYLIFVEYGPQGDSTAKSHSILEFTKADLNASELRFSLSPGKAGHNNALGIFIKNIANSRPGRWMNEIRFTNVPGFPRSSTDYLAKVGFIADFTKGIAKYPKMTSVFESMVLRDTTDETKLPIEGKFRDDIVRAELTGRLAMEGISPSRIYFSGDNWLEYSDNPVDQRQFRTITATFKYTREQACFYGLAIIKQSYKPMEETYGDTRIELKKDLPTACTAD